MKMKPTAPVKLADLKEFPGNPRRHSDIQVTELKRSLEKFGQYRPLVIDENNQVLAGNGMLRAMLDLGWSKGDARVMTDASDADKKKLVLADNRISDMGSTDFDAVDELLAEIGETDIPGWDPEIVASLIATAEESLETAEQYGVLDADEAESIRSTEPAATPSADYKQPEGSSLPEPATTAPEGDDSVTDAEGNDICPTCKRPL